MKFVQNVRTEGTIILDMKDKRILAVLGRDARTPLSRIAKQTRLSRDAVSRRIKLFEENGLIQGYNTVIKIKKFGFDNFHVFLQFNKPPIAEEEKIVQTIKSLPYVRALIKCTGKYDFEVALIARSFDDLEKIMQKLAQACSPYLEEKEILVVTKTYKTSSFPPNFLLEKEQLKQAAQEELYELDSQDYAILRQLASNARMPLRSMAKQVHLSPDAVNYRLKKMVSSHYIVAFIPAINYDLFNYQVYVVLMNIKIINDKEEATLKEFLKTDKNILWAGRTLGRYSTIFYIGTPKPSGVHETIENIRRLFAGSIKEYEVLIAYEEYAYNYVPEVVFQLLGKKLDQSRQTIQRQS